MGISWVGVVGGEVVSGDVGARGVSEDRVLQNSGSSVSDRAQGSRVRGLEWWAWKWSTCASWMAMGLVRMASL